MLTGWTYTEIKNMPLDLKARYLEFIAVDKERQKEEMEQRIQQARGGTNSKPQEYKFIDEKDFLIENGEEFINRKQIDGEK